MVKFQRYSLLVVGLVLFAVLVAPATAEGKKEAVSKPVLTIYDYGHAGEPVVELYKKLVNEYNANPGAKAKLDYEFIPGDAYYTRLNAAVAAKNTPDIFSSHAGGILRGYATAGVASSLNGALGADPSWKDRFISGAFDQLTFDGKIYAIPSSEAVVPIFYNKKIFAKLNLQVPQTYAQLLDTIKTLTANNVVPFADGDKDVWVGAMLASILANRIGGNEPFKAIEDGGGNWTDPSFIKAGKLLQQLVALKAFPSGFLGIGYDESLSLFMGGKAAMLVNGTWDLGKIVAPDSPVHGDVAVMRFPTIAGGKGSINAWLGDPDHNFAVSSTCKDRTAATNFLKVWSTEKVQKIIGEDEGKIIVTKTPLDPSKVTPVARQLNDLLQNMSSMFTFSDTGTGQTIGQQFNNTIQAIYNGADPATEFAKLQAFTVRTRAQNK